MVCVARGCAFRGNRALPIVAVDEPLYRRLPCFVIATVDKFASLPWVGASGALLGGADKHDRAGFYGPWQPGVGQKLPTPLAPPDLIIQDELHLISGPLGTMAGLYETAVDHLCTRGEGRAARASEGGGVHGHGAEGRRSDPRAVRRGRTWRCFRRRDRTAGLVLRRDRGPVAREPGRLYLGMAAQGRSLKVVLLRTYLALLGGRREGMGGSRRCEEPEQSRPTRT